eukprot:1161675-Ditylum_brightwellii.AAC.1
MEFQYHGGKCPNTCINAAYQCHMSCCVSNCFRCRKKRSGCAGHQCGPTCKFRYCLPDIPRMAPKFISEPEPMNWYIWTGECIKQPLCNSNVALILDGDIGQYMHKYQENQNQMEESSDYKEIKSQIKKL